MWGILKVWEQPSGEREVPGRIRGRNYLPFQHRVAAVTLLHLAF